MVRIGMGQDHIVKPVNPHFPKGGSQQPFSHIPTAFARFSAAEDLRAAIGLQQDSLARGCYSLFQSAVPT